MVKNNFPDGWRCSILPMECGGQRGVVMGASGPRSPSSGPTLAAARGRWRLHQGEAGAVAGRLTKAGKALGMGEASGPRSAVWLQAPAAVWLQTPADRIPGGSAHPTGLAGGIVHTLPSAQHGIARTQTTPGVGVTVRMLDQGNATGRQYAAGFHQHMPPVFDAYRPQSHDRAVPEGTYIGNLWLTKS